MRRPMARQASRPAPEGLATAGGSEPGEGALQRPQAISGGSLVTLAVFFALLGVWCAAGYYLGGHPLVAKTLDRHGQTIVPFVLIGLGLYIIYESGTLALIVRS